MNSLLKDWKFVELKTLCDLQNGYAFQSGDYISSSNTLNCRMSNIRPDGEFDLDYHPKFLPDSYAQKYSKYLLNDGDIIIAMTDMATEAKILGVPTVVKTQGKNLLLNQRVGKLVISNPDEVYFPYLKYALNRDSVRKYYLRFAGGGLQLNLSKDDLLSVKIPLPPIAEQKRIAAILDKADAIRRKRQEAIKLTEELGRSLFLDMFGDLFAFLGQHNQNKEFLTCKLGEQITLQRGFDLLKKDCKEGKYPVISSGGIHTYNSEYKAIGPGVLLGRKGSVGRVHYIEENYWPHDTTLWIKDFKGNHPIFVYYFFKWFPISSFEASTANPTLNRNRLHPLEVFWPPYNLQLTFTNAVKSIEKYKTKEESFLLESDNIFNSLLQRAFKGEM